MYILNSDGFFEIKNRNLSIGFGTKKFGDGRNKNLLQNYFKNKIIISPKQNHSTSIYEYKSGGDVSPQNYDGIITREKNIVLSVITADCLPIIFYDEVTGTIAISHQGWKGTLNRFPKKIIEEMLKRGSSIQDIHCIFGPAINDCCYEIYGDRLTQFQKEFKSNFIFRKENQKYFLNLYKANYLSLKELGVKEKNIEYFPFCTSCNSEKFYSYHRDHSILGEMMSFVMI